VIPFSVVIPAHDEEAVIGRLLMAIGRDAEPGEVELVVACNGCRDHTADVARSAAPGVKVVEVERASKIAALNAGDAAATLFPRFYIDADVIVTLDTLRRCASELAAGPALCVSPRVEYDLTSVSPSVARFYQVWQQVPYFAEARIGAVYGLSAAGRARFDRFPDLIADDQFVQQTFSLDERRCLTGCTFTVMPPRDTRSLLLNRTRIYRGNRQLAQSGVAGHGPPAGSKPVLARLARRPHAWPALATYVAVNVAAKSRARRPFEGWERDQTSRTVAARRPIGYVVSHYPARSHTFILREVRQLRKLGAAIETFSIHTTPEDHLLSPQDREEAATTTNLRPVSLTKFLAAHLALALRHPRAYSGVGRLAVTQAPPGLRERLWQVFYFAEAVLLHRAAVGKGVRHLHAHLANAGADVAWLAAELGRRADPAGGWRWSFTMHGPTEFFAVERFNLARKVAAASLVVCISDYCRSQLMLVVDPEHWANLQVVHCGVDTLEFAVKDTTADTSSGRIRILCVGRLTPEKGQSLLVDATARLVAEGSPVELVFVGWGPSLPELQADVRRRRLDDRVAFTGALGQDQLAAAFAAADIFCLPSFAEGVPVVLMEAMATGLPVVSTVIAGVPELVRHNESGILVPPGRPDLLAAALQRLVDDPSERVRLGSNGRITVEKEFDLTDNCRRLIEVLRIGGDTQGHG
jgi:colanic acid/amylovoran biosynthesis glycosyltransferase